MGILPSGWIFVFMVLVAIALLWDILKRRK
jgi:hypothetical protein